MILPLRRNRWIVFLFRFFLALGLTAQEMPHPGEIDKSFGVDGIVTSLSGPSLFGQVDDMIIDSRGGILVAGPNLSGAQPAGPEVVRYLTSGVLDQSFGNQGVALTPSFLEPGLRLAFRDDGGILVSLLTALVPHTLLALYTPRGFLDAGFGSGGFVTTDLIYTGFVAVRPDRRILIAGALNEGYPFIDIKAMAIEQYSPEGELDASFGVGGRVTETSGDLGFQTIPRALAFVLDSDGRVIVSASWSESLAEPPYVRDQAGLLRYTPDGIRDVSFGEGGLVTWPPELGSPGNAVSLAVQPDGKILVSAPLGIARYNLDGTLDATSATRGSFLNLFRVPSRSRMTEGSCSLTAR